jgi:hypothetical protein
MTIWVCPSHQLKKKHYVDASGIASVRDIHGKYNHETSSSYSTQVPETL